MHFVGSCWNSAFLTNSAVIRVGGLVLAKCRWYFVALSGSFYRFAVPFFDSCRIHCHNNITQQHATLTPTDSGAIEVCEKTNLTALGNTSFIDNVSRHFGGEESRQLTLSGHTLEAKLIVDRGKYALTELCKPLSALALTNVPR